MAAAMASSEPHYGTRESGEIELSWIAPDDRGVELEIIAVVTKERYSGDRILLVIHCIPSALKRRRND